ncbi:fluoride efflux transporter FluC [Isoptericola sp. G70]|uniref:fluoride efflux transporter FluC n=1 Tax=Isoptericola sp. G70 TaxID=3376633 RepID=UPI003A7F6520
MFHPGAQRAATITTVVVGGTFGAACREGVTWAVPDLDQLPVATPAVNVVGAFLLGYLYVAVTYRLPGDPRGARLRLLLGTGFCGGFTTYSSLATDTVVLLDGSRTDLATIYVLTTLLLGAVATFAGIVVASRAHARIQPGQEETQR